MLSDSPNTVPDAAPADTSSVVVAPFGPFDFQGLVAFIGLRALPRLELVTAARFRRHFLLNGSPGNVTVSIGSESFAVRIEAHHADADTRAQAIARARHVFDLDFHPDEAFTSLARDSLLGPLIKRHPGMRVPGAWTGFEIAVRAVLGQQVSVLAARTFAGRLMQLCGTPFTTTDGDAAHEFPEARAVATADLGNIGLTGKRTQTLRTMAHAVANGDVGFDPAQDLDTFVKAWTALPGIGPWTAHYIAMRALHHRDAFPAADLGLRKTLGHDGNLASAREVKRRAEAWRPFRAYATLLLWHAE